MNPTAKRSTTENGRYRLYVVLPGRPATNVKRNPLAEGRERKRWREYVCQVVTGAHRPTDPLPRVRLHIDVYRSGRRPDQCNFEIAHKPIVDGLQPPKPWRRGARRGVSPGCSVMLDDDPDHCEDSYEWHRCGKGEDRVEITVEEIECR